MHFTFDWDFEGEPVTVSWTARMVWHEEDLEYRGDGADPPHPQVLLGLHPPTETGRLLIQATDLDFGDYFVDRAAFPVTWGLTTPYVVDAWDDQTPNMIDPVATFTL